MENSSPPLNSENLKLRKSYRRENTVPLVASRTREIVFVPHKHTLLPNGMKMNSISSVKNSSNFLESPRSKKLSKLNQNLATTQDLAKTFEQQVQVLKQRSKKIQGASCYSCFRRKNNKRKKLSRSHSFDK